ncbi:hypothetical protein CBR_g34454 [Chara braunii]|uniref:Uncharacterized protein n=1 Tax=Chara braunii TaxID=69332 RepID=A0A388LIX8_CHABU|nr:hypothetical protein CBR_g34454 [Chara braunii]|eukprot:GBG82172.1 hypothetical protein CBR_g34454 [Chara braunii]
MFVPVLLIRRGHRTQQLKQDLVHHLSLSIGFRMSPRGHVQSRMEVVLTDGLPIIAAKSGVSVADNGGWAPMDIFPPLTKELSDQRYFDLNRLNTHGQLQARSEGRPTVNCREGAPGFVMDTLLTGVEFVKGWGRSLFIQKWSFHQLAMECPSIYEMMSPPNFKWESEPLLKVWRKATEGENECLTDQKSKLEVYRPEQFEKFLREALADNVLTTEDKCVPLPFNLDILSLAHKSRQLWDQAKLPEGCRFFNIVGTSFDTPFSLTYGTEKEPIEKLSDVLRLEVEFGNVDGDGTVPVESAMADGLKALKRVQMKGDHRGILNDPDLFSRIKDFLNPAYDPEVDAVLVPPAVEVEKQIKKEHWRLPSLPLLPGQDFNLQNEDYSESIWAGAVMIDGDTLAASSVTMTMGKVPVEGGKHTPVTATEPQKATLAEKVAGDINGHSALAPCTANSKDAVRTAMKPLKKTSTETVADDSDRHSGLASETTKNLLELSVMTALPEVSISAGFADAVRRANSDSMVVATR